MSDYVTNQGKIYGRVSSDYLYACDLTKDTKQNKLTLGENKILNGNPLWHLDHTGAEFFEFVIVGNDLKEIPLGRTRSDPKSPDFLQYQFYSGSKIGVIEIRNATLSIFDDQNIIPDGKWTFKIIEYKLASDAF